MSALAATKKTPRDVSEFQREQLRFFLTQDNLSSTLAEINPSIAWLPWLAEMRLLQPGTQLAPWLEKNFAEPDSISDVAANIHFFDSDTADVLEFRLNRQLDSLSPLLINCWRLIIRQMRTLRRGALPDAWFDIAPRIERGEQSQELLERLSDALRPKLKIGKRIPWPDDVSRCAPERPTDLLSIDYEIEDGLSEDEVLSVYPKNSPPSVEERLLRTLTTALNAALADAIDVGVESNRGYGVSDSDVPSVAKHQQNAYRAGFLPIVRVMAESWTRLSAKDSTLALRIFDLWHHSEFRLIRRIALFAAANPIVPPTIVVSIVTTLPRGELFVTNSSVEAYRLLHDRWRDLSSDQRKEIEELVAEGPPADWFRDGAETEGVIDRCRFDLLGHLQRSGPELTARSKTLLKEIMGRWPKWQLRPHEQAGFHSWHEEGKGLVGDPGKFKDVKDDELLAVAKRIAKEADFLEGDAWQALCQNDPSRALRGLEAEAHKGQWSSQAWNRFLWVAQKIEDPDSVTKIAQLLLEMPDEPFAKMISSVSWWLNGRAKMLDDALLWRMWDRIADIASLAVKAEENG